MVDTVSAFMSVFADCCHSQELGPEGIRGEAQGSTHSLTSSLPTQQRMGPRCDPPVLPSPLLASSQIPDSSPFQCPRGPNFQKGEGRKERRGGEEGLIREWRV